MSNGIFVDHNGLHDRVYNPNVNPTINSPANAPIEYPNVNLTPKAVAMPEYNHMVEKALVEFFKYDKYFPSDFKTDEELLAYIKQSLQAFKVAISGGFMLKSMGFFNDPKSIDIDTYVPTQHNYNYVKIFSKLFRATKLKKHVASDSDGSFLKKNGIASVQKFSRETPAYAEMDIVEVNKTRTPVQVVQNFDLTFCQVWYDGNNVYAAFPEHLKTRKGFLQHNYIEGYLAGNKVTKKRMYKYISRGFEISIKLPDGTIKNVTEEIKNDPSLAPAPATEAAAPAATEPPATATEPPATATEGPAVEPVVQANHRGIILPLSVEPVVQADHRGIPLPPPIYDGPAEPIIKAENPIDLIATKLTYVKPNLKKRVGAPIRLGGSNGAFLYVKKGEPGNFWVVKQGDPTRLQSEFAANEIYKAAGVRVPAHKHEGYRLIMKHIDGKLLKDVITNKEQFEQVKAELCRDFVIDALIANWDVVGSNYDNIIVPSDGSPPVRIDSGGALTYRAMGGIKKFEMIPNEIHSMRMVGVQAGTIFGNITDNELAKQIKERLLPYHDAILNVTPEDLKHVIKKRIEFMNRWAEDILKGVIRKAGKRTNKQNRKIRKTRKTRR